MTRAVTPISMPPQPGTAVNAPARSIVVADEAQVLDRVRVDASGSGDIVRTL